LCAPRPNPKLEDHPLSALRDCLFNIFAATLDNGGRSYIRNLRTRHAVLTGTHLSNIQTSTILNSSLQYSQPITNEQLDQQSGLPSIYLWSYVPSASLPSLTKRLFEHQRQILNFQTGEYYNCGLPGCDAMNFVTESPKSRKGASSTLSL
jgi:hypothetical protein